MLSLKCSTAKNLEMEVCGPHADEARQTRIYVQCPRTNEHCQFKVTYPNLKLDSLFIFEYSFHFEIDPDCADKCRCKGVIRITEEERCFPHTAIANDEQFEHVVKVLIRGVFLAIPGILGRGHLW